MENRRLTVPRLCRHRQQKGSAKQQADDAASEALRSLEGSGRWDQAAIDADLHFPAATSIFACALGTTVSEARRPPCIDSYSAL
jgi:hypothetical protein